ncbi:MAG: type II secretion system F family protein [Candidatus Omnitrophota bacterium]
MNTYEYSAKDKNGYAVKGLLDANSEQEAAAILHNKELVVLSIKQSTKKTTTKVKSKKNIKTDDLVVFSRQLATMIDAGIPLVHSLGILAEQTESPGLQAVVITLRQDIEAGMSFCDGLKKHPHVFSELFINMVKAGETSGMLDEVLDRLAAYLEKSAALVRKIRSSLVYPAVVVSMSMIITAVLLIKVVPTFKNIFDTLGGQLPLPTRVLILVSDIFRNYFIYLVGVFVVGGFFFKKYIGTEKGRYNYDNAKLKLPVLGKLFRKLAVAKFSRTFSTLVKSGVSILNALDIVSKTAGNKIIEEAVLSSARGVRDGEPISQPLSRSGVFPPMVCRMISVGEQTGQLEKMLTKIADFYEEQVDAAAQGLTSMVEPLVIAFLGIVVGGIVISLFLPVFKITELIAS